MALSNRIYTSKEFESFHYCSGRNFEYRDGNTIIVEANDYKKLFNMDPQNCVKLDSLYQFYCFGCIARKTGNISVCESSKIRDQQDLCIRVVAPSLGDIKYCNMIEDARQKAWFILELAEKQDNESICDILPPKSAGRDVHMNVEREFCIGRVRD